MKISIVIPTYNEEARIGEVLKSLHKLNLPIIVVDDGSEDNSKLQIVNYKLKYKNIIILTHKVNLGKGAALKTGCEYAFEHGSEAVILMDSDGQHLVSDLPQFIEKLKSKKYDVILGSRNLNMGVPLDRYLGNKLASVVVALLYGIYASDLICGFRAITKKAYKKIKWESTGYGVEIETVIKIKRYALNYCEVPVQTVYHDNFKGVSILDAVGVLGNLLIWRFKLK